MSFVVLFEDLLYEAVFLLLLLNLCTEPFSEKILLDHAIPWVPWELREHDLHMNCCLLVLHVHNFAEPGIIAAYLCAFRCFTIKLVT